MFGNDAQSTGLPVEVWRYYLLANRPESQDTDFKWSDLQVGGDNVIHIRIIHCSFIYNI